MRSTRGCSERRGFGSVVALLLLAIASLVIVGIGAPAADRARASAAAVESIRAALLVDAGISVAAAAAGAGVAPAVPAPLASNYPVSFVRLENAGVGIRYRVEAKVGGATRTVDVGHEALPERVETTEWEDQPPYSPYTVYTP